MYFDRCYRWIWVSVYCICIKDNNFPIQELYMKAPYTAIIIIVIISSATHINVARGTRSPPDAPDMVHCPHLCSGNIIGHPILQRSSTSSITHSFVGCLLQDNRVSSRASHQLRLRNFTMFINRPTFPIMLCIICRITSILRW